MPRSKFTGFDNDHTVMKFEHGQRCWGGPDRSAHVRLSCGVDNALLSGDEPAKCEYVFEMATPAMCYDADDAAGAPAVGHPPRVD